MPNYDFQNLSPTEFEDLSRDLIQKKTSLFFESFTNGKDGGIDFRFSKTATNDIIIQCKRYFDFKTLFNTLKKEIKKVKKLNPDNYLITTSVGLTPNQKQEILDLFTPFIKKTCDIYGKEDLNNLLSIYPEIEKQHFKLWLSSSNILEKILKSKTVNLSNFENESIKQTIKIYVDNQSYHNAINIIKDKKYVIISGIPGIGKTTLARILVYHYLANGFEEFIFLSDTIDEAFELYKDKTKQVFLFDDFLGTNFLENKLSNNEEKRIIKFIEMVSNSNDKIIIFTTREYILAQAKQKYDVFDSPSLEFAKCIIDLSQYTKIVKAKILYNHLYFSSLSEKHIIDLLDKKSYQLIINHPNYNPRIIETITNYDVWKNIEPNQFSAKFIEFIKNPTSVWRHVFENQISNLSKCILANLMTCGAPVLFNDLRRITQNFAKHHSLKYGLTYNDIDFRKSIRELENTFIKVVKDRSDNFAISYQNPSVQDFLVYYFQDNDDYVNDVLSSSLFITQFFTVFSFQKDFDFSISNRILLNDEQKLIIVNTLVSEFDYLVSSQLKGYSYDFIKSEFSDLLKISIITSAIKIDNYENLKELIISKFTEIMYTYDDFINSSEFKAYIRIIEYLYLDIEFDCKKILNHITSNVTDSSGIEEIERLEFVFGDEYVNEVSNNERIINKIISIYEEESDLVDDDYLEEMLKDINNKSEKYNIDFSKSLDIIEKRIEAKQDDEENGYDWENEEGQVKDEDENFEDNLIESIFESLRS